MNAALNWDSLDFKHQCVKLDWTLAQGEWATVVNRKFWDIKSIRLLNKDFNDIWVDEVRIGTIRGAFFTPQQTKKGSI